MSDRLNTIFGWLLFAGVVALLLRFGVSLAMPESHRPEQLGYVIEGAETEGGADSGPSLATLLASATPEAGAAVFAKCQACHTIEQGGDNGIGPNLYGVIGEPIGMGAGGFAFSSALADHGGEWTYDNLDAWLASPRAFANGTKMSFAGLSKPEDRANVIAYLHSMGGGPAFPEPEPEVAEAPADDAAAAEDTAEGDVAAEAAAEQDAAAEINEATAA